MGSDIHFATSFKILRLFEVVNKLWDGRQVALRELLKNLRAEARLTQVEMANLLGKPQSYVSKYESGERRLDFVEVLEVCESLGVTPQAFVARYYAGS